MKRYANKIPLSYIFIGTVILIFVLGAGLTKRSLLSGSTAQDTVRQTTIKPLRVDNKTSAFEIADVERNGQYVRLTLKNGSNKPITAFALSSGNSQTFYELGDEYTIVPGGTRQETIAIQPGQQEDSVVVSAVIFKDKTGEGDNKVITEINDQRAGEAIQLSRILPLLQVLLDTPDDQLEAALQNVKTAIKNLPNGSEQESPHFFISGLRGAKESTLKLLEEFEKLRPDLGNDIFKRGLAKNKEVLLRRMEKY